MPIRMLDMRKSKNAWESVRVCVRKRFVYLTTKKEMNGGV